jgi:hypothetical protein
MQIRPGAQVRRTRLGIVVTSCTVVACAPVPDRVHDVAYYRQHADDRQRQLQECANDPGTRGNDPDCVNAREAERMEGIGSLRDLPPMDLPVPPVTKPGK